MNATKPITVQEVRSKFPALQSGFAYLENAGGSQVPESVVDAVRHHMVSNYVQLGAGYGQSIHATDAVESAHRLAADLFNCGTTGKTILGPSTTALVHLVAKAYGDVLRPGDEVIIAQTNHEANAGAWEALEKLGVQIKIWPVDLETFTCSIETLEKMLTERTRLVTMPHVSNLVGKFEDLKAACNLAHQVGADVFADGVAFAPHRAIDVQDLGVDWYVFSVYKVYGPHLAALYARNSAIGKLKGPNHFFIPEDSVYKWELGGVSHEACAGFVGLQPYLGFLANGAYTGRETVVEAFETMTKLETPIEARLRSWLSDRSDLQVIGPELGSEGSVATVSFVHRKIASDRVVAAVDRERYGIRYGNMYAVRLVDALGISRDPGVVRISAVHYNTLEEVEGLIRVLESCFEAG